VIYTSGSTGNPKGVLIGHDNLVHSLVPRYETYGVPASFLLLSSFSFDSSIAGIFGTLCYGGRLCLPQKNDVTNITALAAYVSLNDISHLLTVPSYYQLLLQELSVVGHVLKGVIVAGETCPVTLISAHYKQLPETVLYNEYGPTEGTVWSSVECYETTGPYRSTIGKPISNTEVYILGESQELLPLGVPGELCIGGGGLARGYLNQPELTAAKFVSHPFKAGSLLYRTGDLARWYADGSLAFLGRRDDQVKIRGYRIELGEVEHALQQYVGIRFCVVQAHDGVLVAYIVGDEGLQSSAIQSYLSGVLPSHAIPSDYIQLDELPLTPNGKVDKQRLPAPGSGGMDTGLAYLAPRNATEEQLAIIWQEILGKGKIGIREGFFELGGDSIRILRLVSEIKKRMKLDIPVADIYKYNTIEQLCDWLSANHAFTDEKNSARVQLAAQVKEEIESLKKQVMQSLSDSANIADVFPMSDIEKGMAFASLIENGSGIYHDQIIHHRTFPVFDIDRFRYALQLLVDKHGILRTGFNLNEFDVPVQLVYNNIPVLVPYRELAGLPREEQQQVIRDFVKAELGCPFDLTQAPLWRIAVFNLGEGNVVFVCQYHHAIMDGWSDAQFMTELNNLYLYLAHDPSFVPTQLKSGYKDFVIQHEIDKRDEHIRDFWKKELSGYQRQNLFTTEELFVNHSQILDPSLVQGIQQTAADLKVTVKTVFLGAYVCMLKILGFDDDIVTGVVTNVRPGLEDSDKVLGCFLNTIPLRVTVDGNYAVLLQGIQQRLVTLKEYERLSLLGIATLNGEQATGGNPFFDSFFNYIDFHAFSEVKDDTGGNTYSPLDIKGNGTTNTWFDFSVSATAGLYSFGFHLTRRLKAGITATRIAELYNSILQQIVSQPATGIDETDHLTATEREQQLVTFNDTGAAYRNDSTIISLFEEQVRKAPEQVALVFEDRAFTYEDLNEQANRLGDYLRIKCQVKPNDLICIQQERSEWLIIAILGVLKSGAAYVPVDPAYPQERISYILKDSNCRLLLDNAALDDFRAVAAEYDTTDLPLVSTPDDLLYVIYTSGSTGNPKGCMLTQRGVINRLQWMWEHYVFNTADVILQKTNFTFDVSVWELFLPLCYGAKMVLCAREDVAAPERLLSLISKHSVTCMHFVPGMLNAFIAALADDESLIGQMNSLNKIMASGEALSTETVNKWYNKTAIQLHNLYGPTEASVDVSYYATGKGDTIVPIGKPIWNTQLYVVGKGLQLLPTGVPGEICIGGVGLAKGYLNQPELTSGKFIKHPYREGEHLYRTGDIGCWQPDGNLIYIGRNDGQLKIRGFRIETGEIENALLAHPDITAAVVMARKTADGDKELIAYWVGRAVIAAEALDALLRQSLPAYMLPAHYLKLDVMPLTANGKTDRKQLPEPAQIASLYLAPVNNTEETLAAIWQDILGEVNPGRNSNFFQLGGHSLKATRLVSRIHKVFRVKVTLAQLFVTPVLKDQAALIDSAVTTDYDAIPVVAEQTYYPMSVAQRRIWALSHFEGGNEAYNIPATYLLEGPLCPEQLSRAFELLLERHEILRTVFRENDTGVISQVILPATPFELEVVQEHPDASIQAFLSQPLDLAEGPLLRVRLYQLNTEKWVFAYVMHHIISDGWSMSLLFRELLLLYKDAATQLPVLKIQHKDYAVWQQRQNVDAGKSYWLTQFAGDLPLTTFPEDRPRPAVKTYNGSAVKTVIGADLTNKLNALSQANGGTLYMGLVALTNALLFKYTGQEDVILGTPVAGRDHADLENQIGCYVNTLALRTIFSGKEDFNSLFSRVKELTMSAYTHQRYPFDELVRGLNLTADMSRNALFNIMVVLQNNDRVNEAVPEQLRLYHYEVDNKLSQFDLLFDFVETDGALHTTIRYNTDLYDGTTISSIAVHLTQLLEVAVAQPHTPLEDLDILTAAEKWQQISGFNGTAADYPADSTIISLFEDQATTRPDEIALVFTDITLTYRELNKVANQLGDYLRKHYQIKPNDLVCIQLERSEWLIIAILGVLKSGAAYVPLDPEYPEERIKYIVEDTQCKLLLNAAILASFSHTAAVYSTEDLPAVSTAADLLYVIYTSGSTGRPKGCMLKQSSIVNRLHWMWQQYHLTTADIILQKTNFTFDVSVWEIFLPLCWGARLILCETQDVSAPANILQLINRHQVTVTHFVPGMLNAFMSALFDDIANIAALQSLRHLVTSGEALSPETVKKWYSKMAVPLHNLYGPTEAAVEVSHYTTSSQDLKVPIGRPIQNTQLYILGNSQQLLPLGAIGEICIGGAGLAKGYLNKEQLTSEKFVADPFNTGARLYRTGDQGRLLPDGNILFIGRNDGQVKIRGYRIETGEVENALQSNPEVTGAVVLPLRDTLVAYYTGSQELPVSKLKQYLGQLLPAYAVPLHYVFMEQFPYNTSGKIDRKRLPDPGEQLLSNATPLVQPANETENRLLLIWQTLLGIDAIGVTIPFADLGGHSLLMIALMNTVNKTFDKVNLRLVDILRNNTIQQLAAYISVFTPTEDKHRITLRSGEGISTFIIPGLPGLSDGYVELAQQVPGNGPVYGLQMKGLIDQEQPLSTITEMAAHNISLIQSSGAKTINLYAHSYGGTVLYEMLRQLQHTDVIVLDIVLVEAFPQRPGVDAGAFLLQYLLNGEDHHVDSPEQAFELLRDRGVIIERNFLILLWHLCMISLSAEYEYAEKLPYEVTLVLADENRSTAAVANWKKCFSKLAVLYVSSNHFSIVKTPDCALWLPSIDAKSKSINNHNL
jgi:amino acid adenylation domain-containing protein